MLQDGHHLLVNIIYRILISQPNCSWNTTLSSFSFESNTLFSFTNHIFLIFVTTSWSYLHAYMSTPTDFSNCSPLVRRSMWTLLLHLTSTFTSDHSHRTVILIVILSKLWPGFLWRERLKQDTSLCFVRQFCKNLSINEVFALAGFKPHASAQTNIKYVSWFSHGILVKADHLSWLFLHFYEIKRKGSFLAQWLSNQFFLV